MNTKQKYNGWTNYETWNCSLWFDNDQQTYHLINNEIENIVNNDLTEKDDAISELTEYLENLVDENTPELEPSMYSDMMNASLKEINFYEIAENYINDYYKEKEVA